MSRFRTKLRIGLLDESGERGEWALLRPLVYESDVAGITITVPVGFNTDLASVPRLPLIYMLFGDCAREAAVIHDYLYVSQIVSRSIADKVLKEAAEVTGVPAWRRWGMYLGVRIGGSAIWASHNG